MAKQTLKKEPKESEAWQTGKSQCSLWLSDILIIKLKHKAIDDKKRISTLVEDMLNKAL